MSATSKAGRIAAAQVGACAADVVVMPVQPGGFDLWAAAETLSEHDQADAVRAERQAA